MKKKISILICLIAAVVMVFTFAGCSSKNSSGLKDGKYVATFKTDNKMFHVNDAYHDKGVLTVKNGKMKIHVTLVSENIVNLYSGKSDDAQKKGAKLIKPTTDTVHYDDGYDEEVYGFDIPVPELDKEFDVALIGTHGNWYDHKVKVSNPKKIKKGQSVEDALKAK